MILFVSRDKLQKNELALAIIFFFGLIMNDDAWENIEN